MGTHTGDLVLALPVIEGARALGHEVEVVIHEKYYQPVQWAGLPRVDMPSRDMSRVVPYIKNGRHRTDDWLQSLSRRGIVVEPTRTAARPAPSPLGSDYTLIQPWCEDAAKMWPPQKWAEVVRQLEASGHRVVVAGPKHFSEQIARMGGENYAGQDKGSWASTVSGAKLVLSVDSGAAHVADMLGIPTVVLYSFMPSSVWSPYWDRNGVIDTGNIKGITVDQVMEKVNVKRVLPQ